MIVEVNGLDKVASCEISELCKALKKESRKSKRKRINVVIINQSCEAYEVRDICLGIGSDDEPVLAIRIVDRSGGEEQP